MRLARLNGLVHDYRALRKGAVVDGDSPDCEADHAGIAVQVGVDHDAGAAESDRCDISRVPVDGGARVVGVGSGVPAASVVEVADVVRAPGNREDNRGGADYGEGADCPTPEGAPRTT